MSGILTNRQKWRRQAARIRHSSHDFLYTEGFMGDERAPASRSQSAEQFGTPKAAAAQFGNSYATTGSLYKNNPEFTRTRRVKIMSAVRVVLIPTVSEYEEAGLASMLWWNDDDYKEFKQKAISELREYLSDHSDLSSKEALKCLYQPSENDNHPVNELSTQIATPPVLLPVGGVEPADSKDDATDTEENLSDDHQEDVSEGFESRFDDRQLETVSSSSAKAYNSARMDAVAGAKIEIPTVFRRVSSHSARPHSFASDTSRRLRNSMELDLSSFQSKTDLDLVHSYKAKGSDHFHHIFQSFIDSAGGNSLSLTGSV